jgi:hypothetical protein
MLSEIFQNTLIINISLIASSCYLPPPPAIELFLTKDDVDG